MGTDSTEAARGVVAQGGMGVQNGRRISTGAPRSASALAARRPRAKEGAGTMTLTTDAATARQRDLLETAGRVLAGGGLGLFQLPDEVNLVIAEGHGSH